LQVGDGGGEAVLDGTHLGAGRADRSQRGIHHIDGALRADEIVDVQILGGGGGGGQITTCCHRLRKAVLVQGAAASTCCNREHLAALERAQGQHAVFISLGVDTGLVELGVDRLGDGVAHLLGGR